ncbi:MAG: hypothetical protein H7Z43_11455 [Clostridia bacterium]|nr:hypothetical protein [Deltaproteobacteria bacterium]
MPIPDTINRIVHDWLRHSSQLAAAAPVDPFASFFSEFVAYNALYSEVTKRLLHRKLISDDRESTGDRAGATKNVAAFLGHRAIAVALDSHTSDPPNESRYLEKSIVRQICLRFYICTQRNGRPRRDEDETLVNQVARGTECQRVESVLTLIYKTRCNLFHGGKKRIEDQANLLLPMRDVIRIVNTLLIAKIEGDPIVPEPDLDPRQIEIPTFVAVGDADIRDGN